MKKFCLLLLLACTATAASAQTSSDVKILEQKLHIGDQEQKEMAHAKPDAAAFEATFQWSNRGRVGDVFLVIQTSHLVPKGYPEFEKGHWQTELFLNGQSLGILNKLLRGKEETPKIETLVLPVKLASFKEGLNTLKIQPGAKGDNLENFELHGITLQSSKPR